MSPRLVTTPAALSKVSSARAKVSFAVLALAEALAEEPRGSSDRRDFEKWKLQLEDFMEDSDLWMHQVRTAWRLQQQKDGAP